eukprot:39813-Chlamydomonas_euryale.AAC.6
MTALFLGCEVSSAGLHGTARNPPPLTFRPCGDTVRYGTAAGTVPRVWLGRHGWRELRCYAHGRRSGTLLSL